MKDLYREEKNKDVYADECCMRQSASYSNEYVHWLEKKLRQHDLIDLLPSDYELEGWLMFDCGGESIESLQIRHDVRRGAKWMRQNISDRLKCQ